jgi:serine phosphatase RsbU (regulator of sigma subunit)
MIGSRLLSDIIIERRIYSPAEVLEELNKMIKISLRQETTNNHDGMDVCLCRIDTLDDGHNVVFAGAKNPLYHYNSTDENMNIIRGARKSNGGIASRRKEVNFEEKQIKYKKGDALYLPTDGLIDQCNPEKKKYTQKRLINFLQSIARHSLSKQEDLVNIELDQFQGHYPQRDDITLLGIKL